ncbi:hypothetical protein HanRHA438_Chr10g0464371 [Helianthus annuus]|nr:hypothetical protein HanRHA438_Chr10g0464371 [Helianthus annuus]
MRPHLCEKEVRKRFFNENPFKKQTSCRPLCLRVVCVGKRKEVQKYFSKKTNTTLILYLGFHSTVT